MLVGGPRPAERADAPVSNQDARRSARSTVLQSRWADGEAADDWTERRMRGRQTTMAERLGDGRIHIHTDVYRWTIRWMDRGTKAEHTPPNKKHHAVIMTISLKLCTHIIIVRKLFIVRKLALQYTHSQQNCVQNCYWLHATTHRLNAKGVYTRAHDKRCFGTPFVLRRVQPVAPPRCTPVRYWHLRSVIGAGAQYGPPSIQWLVENITLICRRWWTVDT